MDRRLERGLFLHLVYILILIPALLIGPLARGAQQKGRALNVLLISVDLQIRLLGEGDPFYANKDIQLLMSLVKERMERLELFF